MTAADRHPAPSKAPADVRPSYELARLTSPEVAELFQHEPRLLFAVGTLEQHGPHLPMATNLLIAERVAEEVSRSVGMLRAPSLPYGVAAPTEDEYPGAAGLSRKTLLRTVNELLADWEDAGLEELIIITASSYEPHLDALLMALTTNVATTVIDLRTVPVGDLVEDEWSSEHAGEVETSLLLHLAPERVRTEEIADFVPDRRTFRKYVRGRQPTPPPASPGVVGRPSLATEEKGRRLFQHLVNVIRKRVIHR